MMFRFLLSALALSMLGGVSHAQGNTTGQRPVYTDFVSRVIAQHRVDAAWRSSVSLERALYAVPGDAGAVGVLTPTRAMSPRGGGLIIDVPMKQVIPWQNVAKGVARGLPFVATAVALKDLFDAVRCREAFGGALECDSGVPEITRDVVQFSCQGYVGATPVAACTLHFTANFSGVSGSRTRSLTGPVICTFTGVHNCSVTWQSVRTSDGGDAFGGTAGAQAFPGVVQAAGCPSVVVNGVTLIPVKGPDGRCATNVYEPATADQIGQKIENFGDKSKAPDWVRPLLPHVEFETGSPTFEPPASVRGPRQITTRPDGSTTVRDTEWRLTPSPTGWEVTPREITVDYPPGATIPPQGQPTPPATITEGGTPVAQPGSQPAPVELNTCGLPDTPPCKIDERGTPSDALPDPAAAVAGGTAAITACIANPAGCFPQMPALSWAFAMPTACGVIPLPAFAPAVTEIDVCQFQPIFHDLMSVVWTLGGLFGAISMFWRKTFAA